MYIKKIIIQGFKTYKNATVIDLLSPNHNVIVGRNGSGKSNFFAAIRFVLSDAYTHMTREERQSLIHEGSGTVLSAYVEIIFENSDRRMPIAKDEVSVRRTIGLKKDDYSLDGKAATRSDVMNLLESAGFSRSNPYYIVPQGKITTLTNSKESERLSLLKDVSGAKVFEAKLKESMKEMASSDMKRQRIDEALSSISDRLSDLQIESNDLKEYQNLERQKKIYEFNLFDRELNSLSQDIEKIDLDYNNTLEESQEGLAKLEKREVALERLNDKISELNTNLKVAAIDKDQAEADYNQVLTTLTSKQSEFDQLDQYGHHSTDHKQKLQNDISKYQTWIAQTKDKVKQEKPELEVLQQKEQELKQVLIELSTKQRAIFSKQNRFSKFNNKSQRDAWLKAQISSLNNDLNIKEVEISRLNDSIATKNEELTEVRTKETQVEDALESIKSSQEIVDLQSSIQKLKIEISELSDKRKVLWRDEVRFKSINDSISNDLKKATNQVNQTIDRAQAQGLAALDDIVKRLDLSGSVFGPLSGLINVSDKYKTAAEVVAGASLFHVVVDNDKTASLLMEELVKTKSGRLTFMPLNRLSVPNVTYPDSAEYQCISLLKKVKFSEPRVEKAIAHVFARTVVCSDLQKGAEITKTFSLNAITLDGDRVDVRGVLSGGYRDFKKSRLDALKLQNRKRNELLENSEALLTCVEDIEVVNQRLTSLNNELQKCVRDLDKLLAQEAPLRSALSQLKDSRYSLEQDLKGYKTNLDSVNSIKHSLITNLDQHKSELASEFSSELSEEEKKDMEVLRDEISRQETELDKVVTKSAELETKISSYESEVISNYIPHLEKLLTAQAKVESVSNRYEVRELKSEIDRLKAQLKVVNASIGKTTAEYKRIADEVANNEESIKNLQDKQQKTLKRIEKFTKTAEKSINKKMMLSNRRDEVQKKIRDLGVLPEDAFDTEKYESYSSDDLLKELNDFNKGLSKFEHINKKAIEQFSLFTSQQTELIERREELDSSKASIEELIDNLETQKGDAITKSFRQVAQNFHEIFELLVPAGVGNLIMQKKSRTSDDDDEDSEDITSMDIDVNAQSSIEDYTGVAISVSFNSKHDEQQRIEQLSGGQKSLCAIALILAIQKSDPAPFYLFDEIDANLDTQYRTSVASLIRSLSKNAQFICTTFRPEMLQEADKFYGVTFSNKVSTVNEITRDDATSFVEGQQHN